MIKLIKSGICPDFIVCLQQLKLNVFVYSYKDEIFFVFFIPYSHLYIDDAVKVFPALS